MPRRPVQNEPEKLRHELLELLSDFERQVQVGDLRSRVLALVPCFHLIRDLGSSLLPVEGRAAAKRRILAYFRKYPLTVIHGDEIMVVSGIQDWPRRIRELRKQSGWAIASGVTIDEMRREGDPLPESLAMQALKPEEYVLLDENQDKEAAHRWHLANEIRKSAGGTQDKILQYLKENIGNPVTGEELRYVTKDSSEWARRVRELRSEEGWPILTRFTGRPDLPIGVYVLEQDRQTPPRDRSIPDPIRRAVLVRDRYCCKNCGWSHSMWNRSDPRHLELHHVEAHAKGGENTEENLTTLCHVCHDQVHRKSRIE